MTRDRTIKRARRGAQLAFMATVTAFLLAFVAEAAGAGLAGVPGMVVYSLAAGFGLEFVRANWSLDPDHGLR